MRSAVDRRVGPVIRSHSLPDIWVATRGALSDPWSAPVNLGSAVNTAAVETRPSLSRDGKQLLFRRAPGPEGSSDIYVTTR